LDNDNYLDLAVANAYSDNVSILMNNGDGTFQSAVNYGAGDAPVSVFCADLDNDNYLDLAVANANSDNVSILINLVVLPFIRGDANGDGVINAADVVYLINYLYIGGPAPNPLQAGDVNSDGVINASDVVYLINYLFISGPPPGC
jgi:energy-converting hydrogenase Eha subunit C